MTDKQIRGILTPDVYERLQYLATRQGDTELSNTLRKSVMTEYLLVHKMQRGAELLIRDTDGEVRGVRESMMLEEEGPLSDLLTGSPVNVYLVTQYMESNPSWCTYTSFVVAACTAEEARLVHPHTGTNEWPITYEAGSETWIALEDVDCLEVTLVGTHSSIERGTVLCRERVED